MQVQKEQVIAAAIANLGLATTGVTAAREQNIANVASKVESLVDHMIQGTPCPVVVITVADSRNVAALQEFIEKASVLSADENGGIAISDTEFERFVRNQSSATQERTAKLVIA